jgi:hypothetical protein
LQTWLTECVLPVLGSASLTSFKLSILQLLGQETQYLG